MKTCIIGVVVIWTIIMAIISGVMAGMAQSGASQNGPSFLLAVLPIMHGVFYKVVCK